MGPVPSLMQRKRVVGDRITYIGLDIHKQDIAVAVAYSGLHGQGRQIGFVWPRPA